MDSRQTLRLSGREWVGITTEKRHAAGSMRRHKRRPNGGKYLTNLGKDQSIEVE
jgi:hypothetical protein